MQNSHAKIQLHVRQLQASAHLKPEAFHQHLHSTFQLVIAVTPNKLSPAPPAFLKCASLFWGRPNFSHRNSVEFASSSICFGFITQTLGFRTVPQLWIL